MSFPEQDRAVQILEKEFGPRWKQIVQELGTKELRQRVGKELTSFMAFPERGSGGNNKWRGNCSPEVVRAILRYVLECKHYYGKQTQDFIPPSKPPVRGGSSPPMRPLRNLSVRWLETWMSCWKKPVEKKGR